MRKVDPPAFDFVKCSAILRELRISQKLTHSALAASTGINRQSLIDYEKATLRQGIPTGEKPDRTLSVKGMSINHLCKLAEFYDVSVEYLLGLSDVKTAVPDLRAMCEYTGLSEEALQNLKRFNSAEAYNTQSETILRIPKLINSLFEHYEAFFILLKSMSRYIDFLNTTSSENNLRGAIICSDGSEEPISNDELSSLFISRAMGIFEDLMYEACQEYCETESKHSALKGE